uniref:Uncharacterized protein n=2 Tax=Spongospora subterranea TaxID=70186 RepID=A0A0H5QUW6_9EUKA|eukprot:CRZ05715.1 hypothetical protein [Spongospora subterranea]
MIHCSTRAPRGIRHLIVTQNIDSLCPRRFNYIKNDLFTSVRSHSDEWQFPQIIAVYSFIARCSAVLPLKSVSVGSAPRFNRSRKISSLKLITQGANQTQTVN